MEYELKAEPELVKGKGLTTSNPGFHAEGNTLIKARGLVTTPKHRKGRG